MNTEIHNGFLVDLAEASNVSVSVEQLYAPFKSEEDS